MKETGHRAVLSLRESGLCAGDRGTVTILGTREERRGLKDRSMVESESNV